MGGGCDSGVLLIVCGGGFVTVGVGEDECGSGAHEDEEGEELAEFVLRGFVFAGFSVGIHCSIIPLVFGLVVE